MSAQDRARWDERYADAEYPPIALPSFFAPFADLFPTKGLALDLACGRGAASVWLASRGMDVLGLDISPVAIGSARALASAAGVAQRCRFEIIDLDDGLPPGTPVDVLLCNKFRDDRLDAAVIARLAPGGLLATSALSEVGATPGPFRAAPGELTHAFVDLDLIADGEADGAAWVLARKPSSA
ncbi:MAG: class I SAM-dependent methyltransferase [Mycobacterium sp.]